MIHNRFRYSNNLQAELRKILQINNLSTMQEVVPCANKKDNFDIQEFKILRIMNILCYGVH